MLAAKSVRIYVRTAKILKGPKHEIFGSRVFTQSKPVWVGRDLGTRPKK